MENGFIYDLPFMVPSIFGIQKPLFGTGGRPNEVKDVDGQVIDTLYIDSYWIAEMDNFYPENRYELYKNGNYKYLTVSVVKGSDWQKGVVLIPPTKEPLDRPRGGPSTQKPIDLTGWEDPVDKVLRNIDLLSGVFRRNQLQETRFRFTLGFVTPRSSGLLHFEECNYKRNLKVDSLFEALVATVLHLVELYNDEEMKSFVGNTR